VEIDDTFDVRFEGAEEIVSFRDGDLSHKGVFIADTRGAAPLALVQVRFHLSDLPPLEVAGQLVPSGATGSGYITMDGGDALDALHAAVDLVISRAEDAPVVPADEESHPSPNSETPEEVGGAMSSTQGSPDSEEGAEPDAVDQEWGVHKDVEETDDASDDNTVEGRKHPTPVWDLIDTQSEMSIGHQVRELTTRDKLRLALHATRPVRQILIRDVEKNIHIRVVKNPKVKDQEILEYTSIASLSPLALRWIGEQRRFLRNAQVVYNLVLNPGSPPDLAKKLLARLNTSQLMRIMRSGRVKEAVRRAARKKLMDAGEI